jgi:hypothetical protein
MTTSVTTTQGNDLLLSLTDNGTSGTYTGFGSGETEMFKNNACQINNEPCAGSWKTAPALPGVQTMTANSNSTTFGDYAVVAVKGVTTLAGTTTSGTNNYTYAGTGYADPDAVTQIGNGVSTSTFSYDNNGNLTQKTVDSTSTTYVYDYLDFVWGVVCTPDRSHVNFRGSRAHETSPPKTVPASGRGRCRAVGSTAHRKGASLPDAACAHRRRFCPRRGKRHNCTLDGAMAVGAARPSGRH